MNKMKTTILVFAVALCAGACFARPHGGPRHHGHHGHHHHHHHHRGSAFVGGVVGGIVGGIIHDAVVPRPVVVAQPAPVVVTPAPVVVAQPAPVVVAQPAPVVQTTNVWVPGAYQDQVQANGTVVRVWVPGHYEQRTVVQ